MTDLEAVQAMLMKAGLRFAMRTGAYAERDHWQHHKGPGCLIAIAITQFPPNASGRDGFVIQMKFDSDGRFVDIGAWD